MEGATTAAHRAQLSMPPFQPLTSNLQTVLAHITHWRVRRESFWGNNGGRSNSAAGVVGWIVGVRVGYRRPRSPRNHRVVRFRWRLGRDETRVDHQDRRQRTERVITSAVGTSAQRTSAESAERRRRTEALRGEGRKTARRTQIGAPFCNLQPATSNLTPAFLSTSPCGTLPFPRRRTSRTRSRSPRRCRPVQRRRLSRARTQAESPRARTRTG